jgi:hypothetical protein
MPCNFNLRRLAAKVKDAEDGVPGKRKANRESRQERRCQQDGLGAAQHEGGD